ncbi:hypothetical protein G6F65_022087 [Rhizopus arrhizus]|nr:hypothetical protein G6F65_022087 [Rhizopus arrhizus]
MFEDLGFASLQAASGFFEFRQHAALAEHEREVFGLAAFERHAVDGAGEVQRDAVAVLRGAAFTSFERGALLAQDVQGLLDFGVGDGGVKTGDGQGRQVRHDDFGSWVPGSGHQRRAAWRRRWLVRTPGHLGY